MVMVRVKSSEEKIGSIYMAVLWPYCGHSHGPLNLCRDQIYYVTMEVSGCSAIAVTRQWSMQYLSPHPLTLPPKSTSTNCPLPHYITPNLVHPSSLQLTMTSRRVHFLLPTGTSGGERESSSGECDYNARRTQALAEWWGDFVPIERWNPPRVAHRFPEWGHKRKSGFYFGLLRKRVADINCRLQHESGGTDRHHERPWRFNSRQIRPSILGPR